jgi:hypothetical protein
MEAIEVAERDRLMSALRTGPWRRMAQDRALGMRPQRADMVQARGYRLRVEALERGTGGLNVEPEVDMGALALDRMERD